MQLIDHYPAGWQSQTYSTIKEWFIHESSPHVYLLLDAAFRHKTTFGLIRKRLPEATWRSLYQDAPNTSERVLAASPLLVEMNDDNLDVLEPLEKETTGQPMLSMIVTSEPFDNLWQRLSAFRMVTVQNDRYVLRLTDTRRLPEILAMLTQEQRTQLTGDILAWNHIGRDGHWQSLDIKPCSAEPLKLSDKVRLDDAQLQVLVNMNRVDALIDALRLAEPALYGAFEKPSERYHWIKGVLTTTALPVDTCSGQIECCRQAAHKQGFWF